MIPQPSQLACRIIERGDSTADDLVDIVRGHGGRHTDSNTRDAIQQKCWKNRGEDRRLLKCIIKVVLKIDGVLVNICKEFFCNSLHTNFCITHCSCRVPVNRSKVALAIYQRIAERKLL